MIPPEILRVSILPFGMVNCHLVLSENGCILVDTGLPGAAAKIERVLRGRGLALPDIKLIVVTHAHIDHAGSASQMRALTGAPILAHAGDLDYYEQRRPMSFCSTGWFGRAFLRTGLIRRPYESFTPDILLQDGESVDLLPFGFQGAARHTPGHTSGSVSVQLVGGSAMVGDLVSSGLLLGGLALYSKPKRPPFEDDPHVVADQLEFLLHGGARHFFMGHGGPLAAHEVGRHVQSLRKLGKCPICRGSAASR